MYSLLFQNNFYKYIYINEPIHSPNSLPIKKAHQQYIELTSLDHAREKKKQPLVTYPNIANTHKHTQYSHYNYTIIYQK